MSQKSCVPPAKSFEQHQIQRRHDGGPASRRHRTLNRARLPCVLADDDVDRPLSSKVEAHDSRQGIVGVAASDVDRRAGLAKRRPEIVAKDRDVRDHQVDIEGRTRDAGSGERGRADEGRLHAAGFQPRHDALEQRHGRGVPAQALGMRPR